MKKQKAYILILITAMVSGVVVFISKFGVSVINPYVFTALKNIVVVLLLTGWLFLAKDWRTLKVLSKKQKILLPMVGLIGGAVPFLLYFKGLSIVPAIQAAFIHKTMFLYVGILAFFFLKEKISRRAVVLGLSLFLVNVILLNFIPSKFGWGSVLILGATLMWAIENVLSKYLLSEIPARVVMWSRMFFGSVFIFSFLFFTGEISLMASLKAEQIGWTLITSVLLLCYVASWYTGLKYVKVSYAAIILLLSVPISTMLSFVLLGQDLGVPEIGAFGLLALNLFWIVLWLTTKRFNLKTLEEF